MDLNLIEGGNRFQQELTKAGTRAGFLPAGI